MAYRSSSFVLFAAGAVTSVALPAASGCSAGDFAIAAIIAENDVTSSRSGWTEITPAPPFVSSGLKGRFRWFWKRLVTADLTGTWDFALSGSSPAAGASVVFSGRDTSASPFDFSVALASGNITSGPPAITGTSTVGSDLVYMPFEFQGQTPLAASGYVDRVDNNHGEHVFTQENTPANAKHPTATGWSGNNTWWVALASVKAGSTSASFTSSVADSVTFTETTARTKSAARPVADSVTAADSLARASTHARSVADSLTLSESVSRSQGTQARAAADSVSAADTAARTSAASRSVTDALSVGDAVTRSRTASRAVSDAVTLSDQAITLSGSARGVQDPLTIAESIGLGSAVTVSDSLSVGDLVATFTHTSRTVSDALSIADAPTRILVLHSNITDTVGIAEEVTASVTHVGGSDVAESVPIDDSAAASVALHSGISDSLHISEKLSVGDGVHVTETLAITDSVRVGHSVFVTDSVHTSESPSAVVALFAAVEEALTAADVASLAGSSSVFVTDPLTLAESVNATSSTGVTHYDPGPPVMYDRILTEFAPAVTHPADAGITHPRGDG